MIWVALGWLAWEQQPVRPARGVPAAAMPPHLHQPRPHRGRWGVDRDRVIGDDLRTCHDVVAQQRRRTLLAGGAVAAAEPRPGDQQRQPAPATAAPVTAIFRIVLAPIVVDRSAD